MADVLLEYPRPEIALLTLNRPHHLNALTSEMLDFARPKSLDRREINLEELLTSAMQSLAVFMREHRVTAHCKIDPGLPLLNADPTQLGQVVRNIAWEVIPDLAEMVVKERIRQLESE